MVTGTLTIFLPASVPSNTLNVPVVAPGLKVNLAFPAVVLSNEAAT